MKKDKNPNKKEMVSKNMYGTLSKFHQKMRNPDLLLKIPTCFTPIKFHL